MVKPEKCDAFWFTVGDAARALAMTRRGFAGIRALMKPEHVVSEGRGNHTWIFMRGAIDAVTARELAKRRHPDAELFTGPNSPELRRLRRARAALEEHKLAAVKRETLKAARVRELLTAWVSRVRAGLRPLERRFGRDPYRLVCEALDESGRVLAVLEEGGARD